MIFNVGDTLLSRYRLVSPILDKPGISAWHANDQILAQDCQLFVTNQVSTAPRIQSLASWLGSTRNARFTQVQHLHAENSVCVIVTDTDGGVSLSDYLATDAPLSVDAMRTIMGEVTTAALDMDKVGIEHGSLTSEFIRMGADAVTIADLPVSPLFVAPRLGLPAESADSPLARTLRELGMLLYQMITRMPYIPGQTTSASTLDAARIALPDEFRILCTRTLGLKEEDEAEPPIPMVTVDEFRDLLEPWKPVKELTDKDISLPSSAVSESIQDARIVTVPDDDLVPIPNSIMTYDPHRTQRPDWESPMFFQADRVQTVPATGTAMYQEFALGDTMDSSTQLPVVTAPLSATETVRVKTGPRPIDPANPVKPTVALDVSAYRNKDAADEDKSDGEGNAPRTLASVGANARTAGGESGSATSDSGKAAKDPGKDPAKGGQAMDSTDSNGDSPHSNDASGQRKTRPSVIPPTQPVALSSTMPNRSLADLEHRTAEAKNTQPPRIPPERDVDESASMTFTSDFSDTDTAAKSRPNVAIALMVIALIALVVFGAFVATGLFQGNGTMTNPFAGDRGNTWPSDLPNPDQPRVTETPDAEPTAEETTETPTPTPTPTPTNTNPYAGRWSYAGKLTGVDGVAGYAFIVTLSQSEPVSRIVLDSPSVGGTIYVYADSTSSSPQNGSPVGTGTFDASGTTTVTLNSTVNTQSLSIWISSSDFPTNGILRMNGITVY